MKFARLMASLVVLALGYGLFLLVQDAFRSFWEGLTHEELAEIQRANEQSHWIAIGLLGAPTVWWHLISLVPQLEPKAKLTQIFFSYRLVIGTLIFGLLGSSIIFSGLTERFQCRDTGPFVDAEGNTYGFFCTPTSGYGSEFLILLPALVLFIMALGSSVSLVLDWSRRNK